MWWQKGDKQWPKPYRQTNVSKMDIKRAICYESITGQQHTVTQLMQVGI